ncbi:metal ABC transporter solute-binding protein, Zn/Mn family [Aquibacillus salsiterrae]|uniref:Zinc ABC transporter substrate-binding protein n=1 Tax=Aquibacillus salsiterrae TaxID=2950439 RepID=A0A9X3WEE6_9BACI|nr:zinc ABC transporter substrate-binding protein [Aquibacillus salsiterrae]MDC3415909.1 zinc ABC transporter substrate-binding protein [Aquibacillus salsiterrae]
MKKKVFYFLFTIIISVLLAGCSANNDNQSSRTDISVVAAEGFYGEIVEAVGGDLVEVMSIIDDPNIAPHDYEATPSVSKAVSKANLIVYNGAGYDDWMEKLWNASSNNENIKRIIVAPDLMGVQPGENVHVWYHPETMPKLANELAAQLSEIMPEKKDTFNRNASEFISSLQPLNTLIDRLKQSEPVLVDTSEPVFDYMLAALNFEVNNPDFELAIAEGTDPSPKDLAAVQSDIKEKRIAFFVNNIQSDSPIIQNLVMLTKENDVPVIEVTETNPKGKNYVRWITDLLKQMEKVMKEK